MDTTTTESIADFERWFYGGARPPGDSSDEPLSPAFDGAQATLSLMDRLRAAVTQQAG